MRKAKVSELKARLSSYLAEVKAGDSLIVCERTTPIARLVPYEEGAVDFRIREPGKPISELSKVRPVRLRKKTDVNRVLREIRGER